MTGFGAAEAMIADRLLRVEVRSVNHRWFQATTRLPSEMAAFEGDVRESLRKVFDRGHLTINIRWADGTKPPSAAVDWDRAAEVIAGLRAIQERFDLAGDVSIDLVARQPDLLRGQADSTEAINWVNVAPLVEGAIADCRMARVREGTLLAAEIRLRLVELGAAADRVEALAPLRGVRELTRVRENVSRLLDGVATDPQRIAMEVALMADRLDITEELVRFRAHLVAAIELLDGDKPVGKSLGFLAQELGREVNTVGAKANDVAIAHEVVAMKGELEKIREQLENLE
jgi:uncharacterized protein (TIGR00255 family)